jgi:hypothetical protein
MKRTVLGLLAGAVVAMMAMPVVSAHHSFAAAFDSDKPVSVSGTLTEIRLENPHSWFYVDVKDASGKVVRWGFEASTPTSLIRSGYKPDSLKVGEQVTVKGSHARDASQNIGAAREIVRGSDGKSFIVGPKGNGDTAGY